MSETKKTLLFWGQQEATVNSMYLRANAKHLDIHEKIEIISYLPDLKDKNVLDLASGIGRFTRHFSTNATHLISVDIAPHFVIKNRNDHIDCKNVTFICKDAMNLDIENNSLDFIFINWLLMYLEDHEVDVLLDRIYKWLKPTGQLFLRESCELVRSTRAKNGHYAHFRPLSYYDALIAKRFTLIKEGHIKAYIACFSDPLQTFWHCQKQIS